MFSMKNFEQRKAEIFKRSNERIKRRRIKRSIVSVLCASLIVPIGIGAQYTLESRNTDPIYQKILKFPTEYHSVEEIFDVETDIAIIDPWDSLSITEQYSELDFNLNSYFGRKTKVPNDLLLDKIGEYTAYGFDEIERKNYAKDVEVYSVKNISSDCVVAVKFDGVEEYYIYVNSHYIPATLGDFINDVNLKELISFGNVSYEYGKFIDDTYIDERVEFTNVSDKVIWQKLLSDTTLKNVHSDATWYEKRVISISVDIELLGYKNISLWITEDGYMHTNILDTGKTFYIGKEKLDEFTNYLIDNCDGKRHIFTQYDDGGETEYEFEETVSFEVETQ